jgi:hypothetical protein
MHHCTCSVCAANGDAAVCEYHQQLNRLLSQLNEPHRRWLVGTLSLQPQAPSDVYLSQVTGLDEKTIRRGRGEMQRELADVPVGRQRRVGGGRPRREKKTPRSSRL